MAHLVEVGAGISLAGEVAVLPAPVGPGPCETTEEVSPVSLSTHSLFGLYSLKPLVVRCAPLQPARYTFLWHLAQMLRNAGLAQVLLGAYLSGYTSEAGGQFHPLNGVSHRTVWVPDFDIHLYPVEGVERVITGRCEPTLDDHPGLCDSSFGVCFGSSLHAPSLPRRTGPVCPCPAQGIHSSEWRVFND